MNTIITPTGSYKWVFMKSLSCRWVTNRVQPNESEITNHKPVTDNSVILNAVNALLILIKMN